MYRIICPRVDLSVAMSFGDWGIALLRRRHTCVEYWKDQSYVTLPKNMSSCDQCGCTSVLSSMCASDGNSSSSLQLANIIAVNDVIITRNTFCGTWYLPHSHVHNERNSYNYGRMHGACTKRPYFHFRSEIWHHHRVPRPRFPLWRGNFGDSRTFNT